MATLTELTGEMPAEVEPAYHKFKHIACQFLSRIVSIATIRRGLLLEREREQERRVIAGTASCAVIADRGRQSVSLPSHR
jgi:hypothetical protein